MATKKKTQDQDGIYGKALLVNVKIHFWRGRKHDRVVTETTNADHGAEQDAGRYHKRLFGGKVKEMSAMTTARSRLRDAHHAQTLPWSDEGWRILPTENYFQYTEVVRKHIAEFDEAVEEFVAAYPRLREEARNRLGDMYNENDYPDANFVKRKYGVEVEYMPLPSATDFRVVLPKEELQRARKEVESRVQRTINTAMEDLWHRLHDAVSRLRERMDGDGKGLRDAAIRNLRDVSDVLQRINITGDSNLERLSAKALKDLGDLDAAELRSDDAARAAAVKKADDILKKMNSVFGNGAS